MSEHSESQSRGNDAFAAPREKTTAQSHPQARVAALAQTLANLSAAARLQRLRRGIGGRIVFTTSFGLEDQTILHLLCVNGIETEIVTLDTGRLFAETYALWAQTERRYGRRIKAFFPGRAEVESLVNRQGIDGFYESVEARLSCCHIRKVEPLGRALAGADAWVTGLRADQSQHRNNVPPAEFDTQRQLIKVNPLFDWTRETLLQFAREAEIPINPLHAKGFASIGCAPCTRAITPGEPERAGRWWWENEDKKECGLHLGSGRRRTAMAEAGS